MKHPFFKSILVLAAAAALINCSEEAPVVTNPPIDDPIAGQPADNSNLVVLGDCWLLDAGMPMLIYPNGIVTDASGNPIGTFVGTPENGSVVSVDGVSTIVSNVNLLTLAPLTPSTQVVPTSSSATTMNPSYSAGSSAAKPASSATRPASSATIPTAKSSSSAKPASSAAQQQQQAGTCFDKRSNKNVAPYTELVGANGEKYAYKNDCTIDCWWDGSNANCANIFGSGSNNNQQQTQNNNQQQSSSSKPKSSSSAPKSSSSQAPQNNNNNSGTISSNYTIKYVSGGKSGSGYATRYWDCCEPHCAWPEHGGKASTCDARGNKVQGGSQSMCDGGNAGICRGQFPIVVSSTLAFAFAATPGGENNCGKCFDLAFTGQGKYATNLHSKLKGKHLIVMSSNVGYDVAGGQFDVMIPGGGYGIFDGCSAKMGWGSQGSQYGGLLDECEKETGYTASKYKSCLTEKCNKSFSMDAEARQGCLFMADWMEAAGNPLLEYKEVECPQELIARF